MPKGESAVRNPKTGAAWLSSARALRCLVQSINERNPRPVLYISQETAGVKSEEGEDDVKSAWPLCLGPHTCYNGRYSGQPTRKGEPIPKNRSKFGLRAEIRPHEAGIASNRESDMSR